MKQRIFMLLLVPTGQAPHRRLGGTQQWHLGWSNWIISPEGWTYGCFPKIEVWKIIFLSFHGWFVGSMFIFHYLNGCFPKIVGFTPKSSILHHRVNSIIFTIRFGGNTPIFGNTHTKRFQTTNLWKVCHPVNSKKDANIMRRLFFTHFMYPPQNKHSHW